MGSPGFTAGNITIQQASATSHLPDEVSAIHLESMHEPIHLH